MLTAELFRKELLSLRSRLSSHRKNAKDGVFQFALYAYGSRQMGVKFDFGYGW